LRDPEESAQRNVLVVGTTLAARQVAAHIERHPELRRVVRCCLDEDNVATRDRQSLSDKIATMARTEFVDEVILSAPLRRDLAQVVIREAQRNHLDVKVLPDLYGFELQEHRMESVGGGPLLTLHEERVPAAGLMLKRLLDIAIAGSVLVATAPLMLVIAAVVKIDSPGPALFSALRVGRKGRHFRCHKFRTMVSNAENLKERLRAHNQRAGPTFKIAEDPRITRAGRWLRRYSLDELPQLWNVFKGEMSLVGPRPHPLDDCARYQLGHLRRLDVMPGITGLWQVTARRSASFDTNLALDLEYIEKWSLWMDLRILVRTVGVVFRGTGS
jgi:exopolysaccharide biosynthesis polyprenyl glycosylphosphotransferase